MPEPIAYDFPAIARGLAELEASKAAIRAGRGLSALPCISCLDTGWVTSMHGSYRKMVRCPRCGNPACRPEPPG